MQDYLFHRLDRAGASEVDVTLCFADDAAAILHALSPAFPQGCELWRQYRLLGRFCGPACQEPAMGAASLAA
jgi:hypothetical protein